jgi:zinc protease
LTHSSIEITVVGDVQVDQAVDLVAATFGALPERPALDARGAEGVRFPAATTTPVTLTHQGPVEQGVAAIAWPTIDVFADVRQTAVRQLLNAVVSARLFDSVRAADGAAYSPRAGGQSSTVFKGYGYMFATADVPPAKSAVLFDAMSKIAADLKANPLPSDELDRARNPAVAKLLQQQQTNGYWLSTFAQAQSDPRFLEMRREELPDLKTVTAQEIQAAAARYLQDDKAFKLIVQSASAP